ncbi:MAG: phospholipase D family protein [Candidatus Paracaedibacteraceae bacterium]|nr:phospholipase D family protein [Candidatus Paracaedibacteraceae bacterium]
MGIAFGAGYNIPYYIAATYELPTLIQEQSQDIMVCFSPNTLCRQTLITSLNMAKKSIHLQAYSFTDGAIAAALINAKERGVSVNIILDKSNKTDKRSQARAVAQAGISVYIDSPKGIAHNKVILIDEETVVTGSYNFSSATHSRNAENLLFIKNTELAQRYLKNWTYRRDLSQPYQASADAILINKRVIASESTF